MSCIHTTVRLVSTLFHILAAVILGACTSEGGRRVEREAGDAFRVALLTPGPVSDQSWNAGAYAGLMRIRDSLGAQVSHIHTKTPAEFEENFHQYGNQGYDLVFGHGFEFQDAASRVGPEYPNTVYITTSGNRVAANVSPMVFGFEDESYLAGVLAGSLTRSGVIGVIGGAELPPVKSSFVAFEAGARAIRPTVRVITSYVGSWDDVSAGKEQALAHIRRGADIIFQNADAAGLGVFQAARESGSVLAFGTNANQNEVAPDVIIASVVIDLPRAFLAVAREVKEQRFRPRVIRLGSKSDVVTLALNPKLRHRIPPSTLAAMDSVRALLIAGTLEAPHIDFVDTTSAR